MDTFGSFRRSDGLTACVPNCSKPVTSRASYVPVAPDSRGLESRLEVRELLDTDDATVLHQDDAGPPPEEVRTPALEGPFVGRVNLHAREPHAHDNAIGQPDRAIDNDVVLLGHALRKHRENAIATHEDRLLTDGSGPHYGHGDAERLLVAANDIVAALDGE